jgi:hypothetical protein
MYPCLSASCGVGQRLPRRCRDTVNVRDQMPCKFEAPEQHDLFFVTDALSSIGYVEIS